MNSELFMLRERNENRPPDWRWQRSLYHTKANKRIPRCDDDETKSMNKFYNKLSKGVKPETIYHEFPVEYEIYRIYNQGGNTKNTLESYILADIEPEKIAESFGWGKNGKDLVEYYESIFFDVRGRLKFHAFIVNDVINIVNASAPSEAQIMKILGWIGYKRNLETALLDAYMNLDAMPAEVKDWFDNFISSQLTRKTMRSLTRLDPAQSPQVNLLLKSYNNAQKTELMRKLHGLGQSQDSLSEQTADLLSRLNMAVAKVGEIPTSQITPQLSGLSENLNENDIEKLIESQIIQDNKEKQSKQSDSKQ